MYITQYKGKYLGRFVTAATAKAVYDEYVRETEDEDWEDYRSCPITVDESGNAFITLSGKKGAVQVALVPNQIWHQLTYQNKWNLSPKRICDW